VVYSYIIVEYCGFAANYLFTLVQAEEKKRNSIEICYQVGEKEEVTPLLDQLGWLRKN